ncbi:TrpA Tryptophan synthase alpha chain [Fimbriimonadaceae bacterium]
MGSPVNSDTVITLSDRFSQLKSKQEKALVLFLTAGDQPLSQLPAIVSTLESAGADAIEIGIPFSDPFGEGPTIQASSQRSLDNGTKPIDILNALSDLPRTIPIVTMGYVNPVMRMGWTTFAERSRAAGVTGTIISDLVPEEADEWCAACTANELETIFLVAPTSTQSRMDEVAARSTGFVYAVSRTGVTGAENAAPPEVQGLVSAIKLRTDKPVCVGFGISSPTHVRMVCQVADGAVVGSYLVNLLHKKWDGGAGAAEIHDAVAELKAATRG